MTQTSTEPTGRFSRVARTYGKALTPSGIARRVRIGVDIFRNHQFERYSPITAVPDEMRDAIGSQEVTLPPPRFLGGEGSQTVDGLLFLASLAKALDARTVFEIGTFRGVTAWTLARNVSAGATVHTLDLPYDQSAALELSDLDEANRRVAPKRLFEELPAEAKVEQHWSDSVTFDFAPFGGSCDLVYIDGAHTKQYVERDSQNALSILSETGAIVWDDYWRQEPGVRDVLEAISINPLYRVPGTRLVFHLTPAAERKLRLQV
jgi:predicted O-methyltransferase YrrM